jgi:hypothetical protein
MARFPFGVRLLFDTAALSSRPGQIPTQEARWPGEGKAPASAPCLGNNLLCRIDAQSGHLRQTCHSVAVFVQGHAPDQTGGRLQNIRCPDDLDRPLPVHKITLERFHLNSWAEGPWRQAKAPVGPLFLMVGVK